MAARGRNLTAKSFLMDTQRETITPWEEISWEEKRKTIQIFSDRASETLSLQLENHPDHWQAWEKAAANRTYSF